MDAAVQQDRQQDRVQHRPGHRMPRAIAHAAPPYDHEQHHHRNEHERHFAHDQLAEYAKLRQQRIQQGHKQERRPADATGRGEHKQRNDRQHKEQNGDEPEGLQHLRRRWNRPAWDRSLPRFWRATTLAASGGIRASHFVGVVDQQSAASGVGPDQRRSLGLLKVDGPLNAPAVANQVGNRAGNPSLVEDRTANGDVGTPSDCKGEHDDTQHAEHAPGAIGTDGVHPQLHQ